MKNMVTSKQDENPFKILPKACAKVGDEMYFRILSMDPKQCRRLEVVYVEKTTEKGVFTDEVHQALIYDDPEEVLSVNDLTSFSAQDGTPLLELKSKSKYRVPIWVYGFQRKGAKDFEELGALRFIELSWSQFTTLKELEDTRNADLTWSDDTGKPQYDLVLERAKEKGEGTYRFEGLAKVAKDQPHENYNVADEDALGPEAMKEAIAQWGELQEAMDDFQTLDQIRWILGGGRRAGIASRPSMPGGDESEAEGEPEAEVEEEKKTTIRTRAAKSTPDPEPAEADTKRSYGFRGRQGKAASA